MASAIDDTPTLSVPTHEIIEAKWLTLDEVLAIPKKELRSYGICIFGICE
jgi:hypothetical protein